MISDNYCKPSVLLMIFTAALISACGGGGGGGGTSTGSASNDTTTIVAEPQVDTTLPGFSAEVVIPNVGTYPMTVNDEGKLTAAVPVLDVGSYTITRNYYSGTTLLGSSVDVVSADSSFTVSVPLNQSNLDSNIDDDADGWTNLAEVRMGTDSQDPFSAPGEANPVFTVNSGGESKSQSLSYSLEDYIGIPASGETSSSASYSMSSSF